MLFFDLKKRPGKAPPDLPSRQMAGTTDRTAGTALPVTIRKIKTGKNNLEIE